LRAAVPLQVLLAEMDKVGDGYKRHLHDIDAKLVAIMNDIWKRSQPVRVAAGAWGPGRRPYIP
jgi:hypothetical protein